MRIRSQLRVTTVFFVLVAELALAGPVGRGVAAGVNGRIAIVSAASGNDEIVSVAADGTAPLVLTNDAHVDTDPAYSPDGSQIAFVRQTDGGEFTLWTMPADGGAAVALTPPGISARHPSWSPDGAHIVFDRAGATSGRDLWVVDATGGGLHSIVTHAGADSEPAWSPTASTSPSPPIATAAATSSR